MTDEHAKCTVMFENSPRHPIDHVQGNEAANQQAEESGGYQAQELLNLNNK